MRRYLFFSLASLILCAFCASHLVAQTTAPKRELRGVWIASVSNIDFPVRSSDSPDKQRSDFIGILESHRSMGINAVFVQIRPAADALYANSLEPWSVWLTGTQGRAPEPLWDPLQFMVEEAHKRGMECHAWFNPFRSVVSASSAVAENHISRSQPAWHLAYTSPFRLLNPGLPEVRAYVLSVILDVVRRYDIDGVHFDDYFYPYEGTTNQDAVTFAQHSRGIGNIADWRRDNVNIFVKAVSDSIRAIKRHVKFGISPFGIWRSGTPQGTSGLDAYSVIYCDALAWLQAGTVDYVIPQLYWKFGGGQDYARLMPWWLSQTRSAGRHLYTGLGAYRLTDAAWTASDLTRQVEFNRDQRGEGAVWFSSNGLTRDLKGIRTTLQTQQYATPAFPPLMSWKDAVPPLPPTTVTAELVGNAANSQGITLRWQAPRAASDGDTAMYYAIYQARANARIDTSNPSQILALTRERSFTISGNTQGNTFAVTSLDRLFNESAPVPATMLASSVNPAFMGNRASAIAVRAISPNPAQEYVQIRFFLPHSGLVRLSAVDNLGRIVAILMQEERSAGEHSCGLDVHSLPSGVYIMRMESGTLQTAQMLVIHR